MFTTDPDLILIIDRPPALEALLSLSLSSSSSCLSFFSVPCSLNFLIQSTSSSKLVQLACDDLPLYALNGSTLLSVNPMELSHLFF